MPSDYTIIMWVRHRFGVDEHSDPRDDWEGLILNEDANAPFVGLTGEFPFSCPNVEPSQGAILEFEYRGSSQPPTWLDPAGDPDTSLGLGPEYPVRINGTLIAGGVPTGALRDWQPLWGTRVLLVDPNVLQEENTLRIDATVDWDAYGRPEPVVPWEDKFTIDNVVLHFKTKSPNSRPTVGGAQEARA